MVCGCASASRQTGQPDAANTNGGDGGNSGPQDSATASGSCASPFTGVLATWDFSGAAGNQDSTPSSSTATGVSAGDVARSSSLTPTAGTDSINSSNWTTGGSADTTRFYTFGLQPPSGCSMSLKSLAIDTKASSTGPGAAAVATSDDNFTQMSTFDPSSSATSTLSVDASTSMVELRVYGYSASGAAGTLRIQNTLTVSGSLQ